MAPCLGEVASSSAGMLDDVWSSLFCERRRGARLDNATSLDAARGAGTVGLWSRVDSYVLFDGFEVKAVE